MSLSPGDHDADSCSLLSEGLSPFGSFPVLPTLVGRQLYLGDTLSSTLSLNINSSPLFKGSWAQAFGGGWRAEAGMKTPRPGPGPPHPHTVSFQLLRGWVG